jgi:hypothetical protein
LDSVMHAASVKMLTLYRPPYRAERTRTVMDLSSQCVYGMRSLQRKVHWLTVIISFRSPAQGSPSAAKQACCTRSFRLVLQLLHREFQLAVDLRV